MTPKLEKLVDRKVSSGMYQTASEVVREGLRLLAERDRRLESLRRDIKAGFDAIERGEYTEYTPATIHKLADRVKSRGMERLAQSEPNCAAGEGTPHFGGSGARYGRYLAIPGWRIA
ncbi:MAG TPA: type II toxin-antitoxin system ParD family antitoxin [Bryobacteraceae bacterium]|nr:type II toxin-antitoxin system ParD family antitoxin [Bryobacteraceae bacterium]